MIQLYSENLRTGCYVACFCVGTHINKSYSLHVSESLRQSFSYKYVQMIIKWSKTQISLDKDGPSQLRKILQLSHSLSWQACLFVQLWLGLWWRKIGKSLAQGSPKYIYISIFQPDSCRHGHQWSCYPSQRLEAQWLVPSHRTQLGSSQCPVWQCSVFSAPSCGMRPVKTDIAG